MRKTILLLTAMILSLVTAQGSAAPINYGNFGPVVPGVSFLQVTEDSGSDPTPLFGPPAPFPTGLNFNPVGFAASKSGAGSDLTGGTVTFGVKSSSATLGITTVGLFEAGDYALIGSGTAATGVSSAAVIRATLTEVNGVAVAPQALASVNASFADSLPGIVIVAPWSVGLTLNVQAQLAGLGFGPNDVATALTVTIDNSLSAAAEASSAASIAKKEFTVSVATGVIPEPGSLILASAGAAFLMGRRRVSR